MRKRYAHLTRPLYFDVRFEEPTEWAQLCVPKEIAHDWIVEVVVALLNHPADPLRECWHDAVLAEAPLHHILAELDWATVSVWDLVMWLQAAGDIKTGIDEFLPAPFRAMPLPLRQSLYVAVFLIKALDRVEEDPEEDFGLPNLRQFPPQRRAVWPALRPMWYSLGLPHVLKEIDRRGKQHPGAAAGYLALLWNAQSRAEDFWFPMLGKDAVSFVDGLARMIRIRPDRMTGSWNTTEDVNSQLVLTLGDVIDQHEPDEIFPRSLSGEFDYFITAVQHDLIDDIRRWNRRDRLVVDLASHPAREDGNSAEDTRDDCKRGRQSAQETPENIAIAKELIARSCADPTFRPIVEARLEGEKSTAAIAARVQKTPRTILNHLARLRKFFKSLS